MWSWGQFAWKYRICCSTLNTNTPSATVLCSKTRPLLQYSKSNTSYAAVCMKMRPLLQYYMWKYDFCCSTIWKYTFCFSSPCENTASAQVFWDVRPRLLHHGLDNQGRHRPLLYTVRLWAGDYQGHPQYSLLLPVFSLFLWGKNIQFIGIILISLFLISDGKMF